MKGKERVQEMTWGTAGEVKLYPEEATVKGHQAARLLASMYYLLCQAELYYLHQYPACPIAVRHETLLRNILSVA